MSIVKLSLPFSPAAVEDLRQRLRATRWPDEIAGSDWEYGFSLQFLSGRGMVKGIDPEANYRFHISGASAWDE